VSNEPRWSVPDPEIEVAGEGQGFPVRRIYCVGRNYVDHIREMKEGDERDLPFFFQKPRDAIVPSGGEVPYPSLTEDLQYEGELVIAIGGSGSAVTVQEAEQLVFGYALGIDLTRRDRQREAFRSGKPWEIGKGFDHSAPCGPITPGAALPPGELTTRVNGAVVQSTTPELMIWSPLEIVANLSQQYRLEAGDLIYTGTPAGVGTIVAGDVVRVSFPELSTLEVTVR
jgi:fumarylpyruvate hydrolase